ncbi:MAG: hypothetical protein KatS3mg036_0494 [Ignavibacterium sp.]|uniref:hypothetical protein n=1 Tax=Ignavibacterium sp. TaxID=2651167 RepID=UPI0021DC1672|nr:hypothetical protein [Ignavibacterium sp.]BDQ01940.1 MAG: hypothetical protein KatS3mg037_0515 [Ignavibacterium sp.]GIV45676.1 MAG: hypothetical protein KatS3mg036_0494 [Ignavibacterium sp.]
MTSYLTADEAILFYPQAEQYSVEQIDLALKTSFSLVNSFLDATLKLPAIDSAGQIPYILKIHQARFFQYVLESMNIGYSDELKNLYDVTAESLKKITQNELIVSELQITPIEIGWNLKGVSLQQGSVYIKGTAPDIAYSLVFVCTQGGFPAQTIWDVIRSDSDERFTEFEGSFDWKALEGTPLQIRLDGKFFQGDSFTVFGQPETKKIASPNRILKQAGVLYG